MIINRVITLNPVEPSPLSLRTPMGMETKLDVTFFQQNGSPLTQDLAAQLQLTSRSGDRTATYLMPSTDVVNGKARAVIPADSLNDPNGYRLRLLGTLDGEATLLAMGIVTPIAGAGPDAVPQDTIDQIDLSFERNEVAELDIRLWEDTGKTDPLDTAATVSSNIYDSRGGLVLIPFTVTVVSPSAVRLSLTVEQVNTLPDSCWWSLSASFASGLTTLAEGNVTVTGTVIPELEETILDYAYLKPNDADPASGEIVHGNYTQNILKVAKIDTDTIDQSATLRLVTTGDEIVIGATTWTVGLAAELAGWFEFKVLPVAQDAATGVVPVTFRRPEA